MLCFASTVVQIFVDATRAVENQEQLRLRVEKSSIIATALTLELQALNVSAAEQLGIHLPDDLPSDDLSNRAKGIIRFFGTMFNQMNTPSVFFSMASKLLSFLGLQHF